MLSTLLIAMFLTGAVVAYWILRYRTPAHQAPGARQLSPAARNGARVGEVTPPRYWGLEVIVPEGCCQAAERFNHVRFPLDDAPTLPLAGCDRACQCQLKYLTERRRHARPYNGPERRDSGSRRAMAERLEAADVQGTPAGGRRPMSERL